MPHHDVCFIQTMFYYVLIIVDLVFSCLYIQETYLIALQYEHPMLNYMLLRWAYTCR